MIHVVAEKYKHSAVWYQIWTFMLDHTYAPDKQMPTNHCTQVLKRQYQYDNIEKLT